MVRGENERSWTVPERLGVRRRATGFSAFALLFLIVVVAFAAPAVAQVPRSSHVFLVMLENASFGTSTNAADATTFTPWLINRSVTFGSANNYSANNSGSLLNYIWLSSGWCENPNRCTPPPGANPAGFGCGGGSCTSDITDNNIYRELTSRGMSWKLYAESIPYVGYMGSRITDTSSPYYECCNAYDPHHTGPKWYSDIIDSATQQNNMVPFSQFASDMASNQLPFYSIIVPNDNNNGHDGIPLQADSWLQANLTALLAQPYFQACGDGLMIIAWDDDDLDRATQVHAVVIGPRVIPHSVSNTAYMHHNTLRTIMEALGITTAIGYASGTTINGYNGAAMSDFFGPAPTCQLGPISLTFPNQAVGTSSAAQTVVFTNTGASAVTFSGITASGDFSQTNNCIGSPIAPSATCTINVTFTPTASGFRTGTLTLTDTAANSPQTVPLRGTGFYPQVKLSALVLTFGPQAVSTTSAGQTITITNGGSTTIGMSFSISGDFSPSTTCGTTLLEGASCTVTITFTPAQAGLRTGLLTITGAGVNVFAMVRLFGTGTSATAAPLISFSHVALNFGTQGTNTSSASRTVTITNTGSATLSAGSMSAGGDFAQTNNCGSLAPDATCTINVTFTPTQAGVRRGTITIFHNAPGSPNVLRLFGTGTSGPVPIISFSQVSVNFGTQANGTPSGARLVTVTNTGGAPLTISDITTTGNFAASGCLTSLAPGGACTISIIFTPSTVGIRQGSVVVTDNSSGSPHVVRLFGTGT